MISQKFNPKFEMSRVFQSTTFQISSENLKYVLEFFSTYKNILILSDHSILDR